MFSSFCPPKKDKKEGVTILYIPEKINKIIGTEKGKADKIGMSGASVLMYENMVLKIEKQSETADNEYSMLKWLRGKLRVPEIILFERENGVNYILMEKLRGKLLCDDEFMRDKDLFGNMLASALKELRRVDISDCPRIYTAEEKLKIAEKRLKNGLCTEENADRGTYGEGGFENPQELYNWLKENKPQEELVFSHGDLCLPNIIINGVEIGYIDLGLCGIADIYQDASILERSAERNYTGKFGGKSYGKFNAGRFYGKAGIKRDNEKIRYYRLLDELF